MFICHGVRLLLETSHRQRINLVFLFKAMGKREVVLSKLAAFIFDIPFAINPRVSATPRVLCEVHASYSPHNTQPTYPNRQHRLCRNMTRVLRTSANSDQVGSEGSRHGKCRFNEQVYIKTVVRVEHRGVYKIILVVGAAVPKVGGNQDSRRPHQARGHLERPGRQRSAVRCEVGHR